MASQRQGLESPSEAAAQQSTCLQAYDKNNQHTAQCVFKERGCESSSKRHLKYTLMEWYIYLNERHCLPKNWDCPLLRCNQQRSTFADVITHLDECRHIKTNTRQYTCPGCQKDVQMPAKGHGEKAMLKIRRSLDNVRVLGYPSSPARSPSTGSSPPSSLSFDDGPSQQREEASPLPYMCGSSEINSQAINSFSQHNRNFAPDPIVTQFGPYTSNSCPSSTTTNSSYDSGYCSAISSQGILSAVSSSTQLTSPLPNAGWNKTPIIDGSDVSSWANNPQLLCNPQHVGDQSCEFELSANNFLQEPTNIGGLESSFPGDSDANINYGDVDQEYLSELTSILQNQWSQRGEFSSFMPEPAINAVGEQGTVLEVAGSTYPVQDLFSPVSSDVTMVDSPTTSEASPPAVGSPTPKCKICKWVPDTSVKRSLKKLAAAVEKHITRNHKSRNSQCPICYQVFKNRPDNVKPHVARKHADMLASLYPTKAVLDAPQHEKPIMPARTTLKRRASHSASQASPARGKQVRFQRGLRG